MAGAFFDNKDWFSSQTQGATIDREFDASIGQTPDYQNADPAGKADMKLAFKQLIEESAAKSLNNPAVIQGIRDQSDADNAGALENAATAAGRSTASSAYRAVNLADDLVGPADKDYAKNLSLYAEKQRNLPMTRASKELGMDMARWRKEYDAGDLFDKAIASAKLVGNVIGNPEAILQTGAESAGSLMSSATGAFMGAKAGGVIGSVIPGAGTAAGVAVGTPVGMFLGSAQDAATSKMSERILEALEKNGVAPTESNIQMFLDKNPGLVEQSQQDAVKYGTILGVIDTALGGLFSRFATLPTRAARKTAMQSMDDASRAMLAEKAKELGVSATDLTEDFINAGAKDILASQSFKSKLGYKSASYGGEVIGEPVSEAAATASVGEKIKAEDLIYETIGGVGAGPVGASINTAAMGSKLVANKTGEFTKKILESTPESRALAKEQKQEIKAAEVQKDSATQFNFNRDVKNTDPMDPVVDKWGDPANQAYDPIKAVTILAKAEEPDTDLVDRARAVQNNFKKHLESLYDRSDKLIEKAAALEAKGEDVSGIGEQIQKLNTLINVKTEAFQEVAKKVASIKNKAALSAQSKELSTIDTETATPDEVTSHITESLGSHGNKSAVTNAAIEKLKQRKDLSTEQHDMLEALTVANVARQGVMATVTNRKSQSDVSNDIYNGMANSEFKGIDAYHQGITNHLQAGRTKEAEIQLEGLKKFQAAHQLKSDRVSELYEVVKTKGIAGFTPAQAQMYKAMQRENPNFELHPVKSKHLVPAIAQEAAAIAAEVKVAESLLKVHATKGQATTAPAASSTPTINPPQPAVETKSAPAPAEPIIEPKESVSDLSPVSGARPKRESLSTVREDVAPETEEPAVDVPTDEINDSTIEEIADSFDGVIDPKLQELSVTYTDTDGTEVTQPFNKVMQELDTEINEAEEILKCFTKQ